MKRGKKTQNTAEKIPHVCFGEWLFIYRTHAFHHPTAVHTKSVHILNQHTSIDCSLATQHTFKMDWIFSYSVAIQIFWLWNLWTFLGWINFLATCVCVCIYEPKSFWPQPEKPKSSFWYWLKHFNWNEKILSPMLKVIDNMSETMCHVVCKILNCNGWKPATTFFLFVSTHITLDFSTGDALVIIPF